MAYASVDAARVAKAAQSALKALSQTEEKSEAHQRKTLMIERIGALAVAASETEGSNAVTLTSEEFWMISKNW
ncbi:hypothetical protein AA106555_1337 [Neokomagataea thailandica NBRC 106555]|uniref:Uncharacterized protein n=2 Tax=Neokomagataea TaxID=1223423 RepID=A0A4Y6V5K5_9PROT|nr:MULTISPECIES: hypothetical protein [Neokomagataea]QDH25402.1 hypothetical protein D5366_09460 [Neokomagataea tanensis]GBR53542.1 hypothetical protein AA106555_1337 [Neokomagataea thailandica NBRC 106555]